MLQIDGFPYDLDLAVTLAREQTLRRQRLAFAAAVPRCAAAEPVSRPADTTEKKEN